MPHSRSNSSLNVRRIVNTRIPGPVYPRHATFQIEDLLEFSQFSSILHRYAGPVCLRYAAFRNQDLPEDPPSCPHRGTSVCKSSSSVGVPNIYYIPDQISARTFAEFKYSHSGAGVPAMRYISDLFRARFAEFESSQSWKLQWSAGLQFWVCVLSANGPPQE